MMGLGASRVNGDCGEGLNHMTSFGGVTWLEGNRRGDVILTMPPKETMKCSRVSLDHDLWKACQPNPDALTKFHHPRRRLEVAKAIKEMKTPATVEKDFRPNRGWKLGAMSSAISIFSGITARLAGISIKKNLQSIRASRSHGSDEGTAPPLPHLPTHVISNLSHPHPLR